jgi:hypothetical protein
MYCDITTGNICFKKYLLFYKDYSLFPDLINMVKLKNIFFTLKESMLIANSCTNTINHNNNKNEYCKGVTDVDVIEDVYNNDDGITFSLFVESLAITGMMFNYNNILNDMDKMLYLVERINQSKACKNMKVDGRKGVSVNKEMSEFIRSIKQEYPVSDIRKVKLDHNRERIEERDLKFDDIFQDDKGNDSDNEDNDNCINIEEQDVFE